MILIITISATFNVWSIGVGIGARRKTVRLIDADEVLKRWGLKFYAMGGDRLGPNGEDIMFYVNGLLNEIQNAPTVEQECYISGTQWNEFMEEHKRRQDTLITEIIEELESRKDYGTEYAQAMEDVIVILKAKFGIGERE